MTTLTLFVNDMHCAACTQKIARNLRRVGAIEELRFNPVRKQVLITHNGDLDSNGIIKTIENAGFHPTLTRSAENDSRQSRDLLLRLGVAGLALMQVMMAQGALYAGMFQGMEHAIHRLLEYTALIFCIPVVSYAATPFFKRGLGNIATGVNMDTPIALAILIAFLASLVATLNGTGETYYDSVAMFTFLMLGARYFDARLRLKLGIETGITAALPKEATVIRNGVHERESVDLLRPGETVWVDEGGQLPADGILLDANCTIDEALLSGESDWQERYQSHPLFAGTYNRGAAFKMQVSHALGASRLAEIEQISNTALAKKHRLASLADRIAAVFIPTILLVSLATGIYWLIVNPSNALSASLAVLIVSCPCALSLATPAALAAAMARLRECGVLIKSTRALEVSQKVGSVVFDKTGTLASPEMSIYGIQNLSHKTTKWCVDAASALQLHSSHPLASAFSSASTLVADSICSAQGGGLSGLIEGSKVRIGSAEFCAMTHLARKGPGKQVYLSLDGKPAAVFDLIETPRLDAAATINSLRKKKIQLELLSGDKLTNCRRLAEPLRLPYLANQRPEQKFERMQVLRERAHERDLTLMYVGDGMNDIPALAAADVSVATLETNDLVKSKADVVLLTQRLSALLDLVELSGASQSVVRQNLIWALLYNAIAIPWAITGTLSPWAAALGMSLSSIAVLVNSSRLLNATTSTAPTANSMPDSKPFQARPDQTDD